MTQGILDSLRTLLPKPYHRVFPFPLSIISDAIQVHHLFSRTVDYVFTTRRLAYIAAALLPNPERVPSTNTSLPCDNSSNRTRITTQILPSSLCVPPNLVVSNPRIRHISTTWAVASTLTLLFLTTIKCLRSEFLVIHTQTHRRAWSPAADSFLMSRGLTRPSCRSMLSESHIKAARTAVLDFFDASPDDYVCVFTSNATGALKIVGESYPFSPQSSYVLSSDSHNSVNGIRKFAHVAGAEVHYLAACRQGGFGEAEMKVCLSSHSNAP